MAEIVYRTSKRNLAAAEVEVMSSTSTETCELWNGHSVIRCPGSADICQFICLIPNECDITHLKHKKVRIRCENLDDIAEDAENPTKPDESQHADKLKQNREGIKVKGKAAKLLQKKERAGPRYIWQCFQSSVRLFSDKLRGIRSIFPEPISQDEESGTECSSSNFARDSTLLRSWGNPTSNNSAAACSKDENDLELVVVMENLDGSAPNLLLNCHDRVGRTEIYIAAAFGTILQLGAIAYFAFITYHKSIQDRFLKDGERVVPYAFPCAAIGTILLVFGLFICSWVVGESTEETYYEAAKHAIFMVWIQKDHTVSDQVFKPYAIYPITKRKYITTSRRRITQHRAKELTTLFKIIVGRLLKDKTVDSEEQMRQRETDTVNRGNDTDCNKNGANERILYWPLEFVTFVGALTSLIGFISQFIGMRGLNWTASVVQLGITIALTMIRAIVRRGLGKPPAYTPLTRGYELDWFILSLGDLAKAPWAPFSLEPIDSGKKHVDSTAYSVYSANSSTSTTSSTSNTSTTSDSSATLAEKSSKWEIHTGNAQAYLPLNDVSEGNSQSVKSSVPHEIMRVRKELGEHSKWKSPVSEEAMCLSRAIETVANTFLREVPKTTKKYSWSIPAKYTKQNLTEFDKRYVYVTISRDEQDAWQVDEAAIEAILSLWLFSTSPTEHSKTKQQQNLRLYGLSESKNRLMRDLKWWMPEKIPKFSSFTKDEIAKLANEGNGCQIVGFRTEDDDADRPTSTVAEIDPTAKYLVLESQDKKEKLFSRDLLFSFIRAVAKTPEATITSVSSQYLLTNIKMGIHWRQMKFKDENISELVRKLEHIGFGTISDIYIDLLIPLSLEQKLSNAKNVIDEAARLASEYEHSHQWENVVDTCFCLLDLAANFDLKKEPSSPRAIAICLGFLYRLQHEARLQEFERRTEEELTIQLERLKEKIFQDYPKVPHYIPTILKDNFKVIAISRSTLASPIGYNTTSIPDSFQIADENLELIKKSESRQEVQIPDIKILKKTDAFGWSLLHYAASSTLDNIEIYSKCQPTAEMLKSRDLMEWTPLHHACFLGNEKMVEMLLKYNTPIEIAGNGGITPIHCAVRSGNTEILQSLMDELKRRKKNIEKNKRRVDRNERHPIHWAAVEGNVKMVKLMEDDIGLTDRFGWTPLHLAAIYGQNKLLQYISQAHSEAMKGDNMDVEGRTPLYLSVEYGEIEPITVLIDKGANVRAARKDGRTPLHAALGRGKDGLEVAKMLLHAGAYVNTAALDGSTGLHIAAQCGILFDILTFLPSYVSKSLDINATDVYGQTPLLIAIYEKEWDAARLLLDMGADVNADKRSGYSPVLGAVVGEKKDILQKLLDKRARVNDADEDGFSALHLAILSNNQGIFQALLDANAEVNAAVAWRDDTPLHIAVRLGQIQNIQALLDKGAETIVFNFRGFSPLQQALKSGYVAAVRILVDHDKRSNIKAVLQQNEEGDTPLHTLAAYANTRDEDTTCEILDELLSIGPEIDINAKNREGRTPLDVALFNQTIGRRIFIAKLLERGAEPGSD